MNFRPHAGASHPARGEHASVADDENRRVAGRPLDGVRLNRLSRSVHRGRSRIRSLANFEARRGELDVDAGYVARDG